jgi:hypothetical protein
MKLNLKTISLTILVITILYFLFNKKQNNTAPVIQSEINTTITLVDKKSSKLAAPEPLNYTSAENRLGVGNNWRSR